MAKLNQGNETIRRANEQIKGLEEQLDTKAAEVNLCIVMIERLKRQNKELEASGESCKDLVKAEKSKSRDLQDELNKFAKLLDIVNRNVRTDWLKLNDRLEFGISLQGTLREILKFVYDQLYELDEQRKVAEKDRERAISDMVYYAQRNDIELDQAMDWKGKARNREEQLQKEMNRTEELLERQVTLTQADEREIHREEITRIVIKHREDLFRVHAGLPTPNILIYDPEDHPTAAGLSPVVLGRRT